jgi:ABC-type glycerol-3-phosphate transport system substrate-binding protein
MVATMRKIADGKTKTLYALGEDQVVLVFKDDVTGTDGGIDPGGNRVVGHVEGKGLAALRQSAYFFSLLAAHGVPTHFVSVDLDEGILIARRATWYGLEFVVRFRAFGSFVRRYGRYVQEGADLGALVEITLKDTSAGDGERRGWSEIETREGASMCATRKVFGWGLVIWLVCSLAAVSTAQVTVRWAEYPRAGMDDFKRLATERFNARYPDIRVVYEPVTDATKLTVAMAGGTAPDVVTWWTDTLQGWGESGLIIDLDPFVKRDLSEADLADFNPGQMKAFRLGSGYLYALPLFGGTWATWFNADKFDEAGVPRPSSDWNWDALVATARKLTRYDGSQVVQWGVQAAMNLERMTPFLRQNGAELHPDGDNSACLLNQPAAVTAIDFVAGLIHRHNVMPIGGFEGVEAFKAGKVALEFEGSWAVNWYLSLTEYRLGLVEPPRGPVARSSIVAFEGYGITRNSANTDAAWYNKP